MEQIDVAALIREARERAGMSQRELAEVVGMRGSAIARLESPDQNPRLETLQRIAEACGGRLRLEITGIPKRAPPRGRGRPRIHPKPDPGAPKRKPGRPRKRA